MVKHNYDDFSYLSINHTINSPLKIEELLKLESIKEYQKEKEVLLHPNSEVNQLVCDLDKYPHAFVLACAMDRQLQVERVWSIPYKISNKLGGFSIELLYSLTLDEYKLMFNEMKLHRFNDLMAEVFYDAIHTIVDDYNGDAANIWIGKPSSATVVSRFLDFSGIGIKIATMATNILARDFKVELSDYYSIDISPDVHVKRVFKRLGLIKPHDINDIDKIIYKARSINPQFPGMLDLTCWQLGKTVCRPHNPKCEICVFNSNCPKMIN